MDTLTSLIPHGLPVVGGGLIGFVLGYICRKLIKIAIIGLGLIFALASGFQRILHPTKGGILQCRNVSSCYHTM